MGREIRRVPADWEHPRYTKDTAGSRYRIGDFMPLYGVDYKTACDEWERDFDRWRSGEHPDKAGNEGLRFWEWAGGPPDEEHHRERAWTSAEATHFQVYETVSEGTPVTPHFATEDELVDYLVKHGDFWDQHQVRDGWRRRPAGWSRSAAEEFVKAGDAPSAIAISTPAGVKLYEPRDGRPEELAHG